ncbi:hypothetical protein A3C59_01565 [Candidatus Daviesbacteria bacterium RIFCSPHIGHO2_02_FULL_36_13]|uniref:Uncharacterized protein n=1 Tax=Candidatus Daviesbacteria bacterium RIFCSPHIGHO2_02_FULL_36_13 TaxID=1797768 RepID=A0A1F5JVH2_9BACT|nr:MAG: hypothetical protein A3C59_01565 [Candidatus Daviesbacteria bacterium RIFCSPHIGHO2_02_FULL_36_13]
MKTLVTHINPHLDDIVGIWLFKKYNSEFADANVEFISASRDAGGDTEEKIFIGTGGGQFDEHKEGLNTCAGSLVFDYLKAAGNIPDLDAKALEKLIEWNLLVDTGKASSSEFDEFSIQSFIRTKDNSSESSRRSVELGQEILDRVLEVLRKREQSKIDWEKAVEFESQFGKGYAVESETVNREFVREKDGDLYLMVDPKYNSVQYFSPEKDISAIYEKVKEKDPEASWFLHQSHHMVICGSSSAPDSKPTKLSMEELIEAAK